MSKRFQATVHGRVQGVSFRYYTRLEALRLGVKGWVRNEQDGTVSVTAEGSDAQLKEMITYLHRGSPAALVSRVEIDWLTEDNSFNSFEIRW